MSKYIFLFVTASYKNAIVGEAYIVVATIELCIFVGVVPSFFSHVLSIIIAMPLHTQ